MTIEEAIQHCKEVAKENRKTALEYARAYAWDTAHGCRECANEYEQLAEWLEELKQRREDANKQPKTNADRIRQMTDEEELLSTIGTECYRCAYRNGECDSGYGEGCIAGNLKWLKQEVSEDAGS